MPVDQFATIPGVAQVRYGGGSILWSLGRVQTPVLALIAARDDEIRDPTILRQLP